MNLGNKIASLGTNPYQLWIVSNEPDEKTLDDYRQKALSFTYRPKISLITSLWNADGKWLKSAIASVLRQVYNNWELCLAVGADQPQVSEVIRPYAQIDSRIKIKLLPQNKGVAANYNEALSLATGEFISLLGHEDELAPFALYECVRLLNQRPQADMIYSDEDRVTDKGKRFGPFFKPDWSPDTLLSCPYTGNLGIYRKKIVDEIGGFRTDYNSAQAYDMVLWFIEKTNQIYHIPKVLYHRRDTPKSAASRAETSAGLLAKKAIEDHLTRNGIAGRVVDGLWPGSYRVRRQIIGSPLVSIIIPSKDKVDILRVCVNSIISRTDYANYEILIVDNGSTDPKTLGYYHQLEGNPKVRILHYDKPFNFSALNNYAVSQANGEHLLFLNDDTEVMSTEWLSAMLEHSQRKEVGAVGAKLLFPDGTIQHCGIVLGLSPFKGYSVAGQAYYGYPDHPGYMGRISIISDNSAVTAACMLLRKQVFKEVGGFDQNLAFAYNDVDLCLKIREKGYLVVYTPYARLYHHESRTRGYEDTPEKQERFLKEIEYVRARWGPVIDKGDPYYNRNLALDRRDFSLPVLDDRTYSELRNLVYRAIAYYRRHGIGRTIRRIFIELKTRLTSREKVEIYPIQSYQSSISRASTLKKVSFLVGLPRGESKRYRVYNIVEGLQDRAVASCVFYETDLDKLGQVMDSNLVVIFRAKMSPRVEAIIDKLHSLGISVVFDIDDLVFDIQYVNYIDAFKRLPDALKKEYMSEVKGYRQVLERCDFVTCTTEFLADTVRQLGKSCFVVPNTINKAQYELSEAILKESRSRDNKIRIGYFSGTATHDRDFLEASGALLEILKRYRNTELHIVGSVRLPRELKKSSDRVLQKPLMPYLDLLRYISKMDINIAPLEQGTPFNEGKSELKIFEAALVGVPTIASRTDSYSKCITDGENGFLAGSNEEWLQKLCHLIENERLRTDMGREARKYFVAKFYIENVIDDIIKVYENMSTFGRTRLGK